MHRAANPHEYWIFCLFAFPFPNNLCSTNGICGIAAGNSVRRIRRGATLASPPPTTPSTAAGADSGGIGHDGEAEETEGLLP